MKFEGWKTVSLRAALVLTAGVASLSAQGSAGSLAQSCGVPTSPARGGGRAQPQFPAEQYPVKLPPVSMLGAHNDLPNPYRAGVSWGDLPAGRKWGSSASIKVA